RASGSDYRKPAVLPLDSHLDGSSPRVGNDGPESGGLVLAACRWLGFARGLAIARRRGATGSDAAPPPGPARGHARTGRRPRTVAATRSLIRERLGPTTLSIAPQDAVALGEQLARIGVSLDEGFGGYPRGRAGGFIPAVRTAGMNPAARFPCYCKKNR